MCAQRPCEEARHALDQRRQRIETGRAFEELAGFVVSTHVRVDVTEEYERIRVVGLDRPGTLDKANGGAQVGALVGREAFQPVAGWRRRVELKDPIRQRLDLAQGVRARDSRLDVHRRDVGEGAEHVCVFADSM